MTIDHETSRTKFFYLPTFRIQNVGNDDGFVGQSCEVLWEGQGKPLADGMQRFSGYTRNYLRVHADVAEGLALSNRITPVILGPVDEVGDSMAAHLSPSVLDTLPKTSSFPTFWMRNVGK